MQNIFEKNDNFFSIYYQLDLNILSSIIYINTMDKIIDAIRVHQLNLDLGIVRQLSKPLPQQRICPPKNIRQLLNLLRRRNIKYNYTQQQKDKSQQWFKKQNVDIKTLDEKIKSVRKQTQKSTQQKQKQQDCYFYFPSINRHNEDDYLNRNIEYGMFTLVESAMENKSIQAQFKRKLISKLRKGNDYKFQFAITQYNSCVRQVQKKKIYTKIIKDSVQKLKNEEQIDLLSQFQKKVPFKLWGIISGQLQMMKKKYINSQNSFDMDSKDRMLQENQYVKLIIGSLKLVQHQYDSRLSILSNNQQSIKNYIISLYLNKIPKQNNEVRQLVLKQPYWGIAYLYYRAGRKREFQQILAAKKHREILSAFQEYDRSIKKFSPQISLNFWTDYTTEDIFYQQLLFILKGIPKFSQPVLCDPNSLDRIWILLRTCGLFTNSNEGYEKFQSLKSNLFKYYLMSDFTSEKFCNMAYLLGYSEIIELGQTDFVDTDDYLHLLIVLQNNPILIRGSQQKIALKLCERLSSYIYELIIEKRQEYLAYLPLFPSQYLAKEVSQILSSSQLLTDTTWKYLKERLPKQLSNQLLELTLQKYILLHKNYLLAANYYKNQFSDEKKYKAIEIILQMLLKSTSQIKFSKQDIKKAQQFADAYCREDIIGYQHYQPIFKMLVEMRMLNELIKTKNTNGIVDIIAKSQCIVHRRNITQKIWTICTQLSKRNCLDIYFLFLQKIITSVEIVTCMTNSNPKLIDQIERDVIFSLQLILSKQQYSIYATKEVVISLKNHLNSVLWKTK